MAQPAAVLSDYPDLQRLNAIRVAVKTCSKCGETKPLGDFRFRKGSRDGRHGWCNPCYNAYYSKASREWRQKNRERDRASKRRQYRANSERELLRARRYREANRELVNARSREGQRRAYAENPAPFLAKNSRRRGVTKAIVTPEIVKRIAELLLQPCTYCGATEKIEIDHIIPLSRGGKHEVDNLAAACRFCNRSKKDRLLSEWRTA